MTMAIRDLRELSGLEKASALLMAMGTNTSAEVLKLLSEQEIEKLSGKIVNMRGTDPGTTGVVLTEFKRARTSDKKPGMGGRDFAAQVLQMAVGEEKASEFLRKAASPSKNRPFEFLWEADSDRVADILGDEPPNIVAVVLANLPPGKSAAVLSKLDESVQAQTAIRICSISEISPEAISAIDEGLRAKVSATQQKSQASIGPKALVDILNNAGRSTERIILAAIKDRNPDLGHRVRSMIFTFDDLVYLDDRSIQVLLREVDQKDLMTALKGADDEMNERFFRNMSERAVEAAKEDMAAMGPVRVRDIEVAQQRIEAVVRELLSCGRIVPAESNEEQVI